MHPLGRAAAVPEPSAQPPAVRAGNSTQKPFSVRTTFRPTVVLRHSVQSLMSNVQVNMFDPAEPGSPASRQCVRHTGHTRGLS
jgi:hypothetical protein